MDVVQRPGRDDEDVWAARRNRDGFVSPETLSTERYVRRKQRHHIVVDKSKRYLWDNHWIALRPEHAGNQKFLSGRTTTEVELVPEPTNEVDPTAVAVYVKGHRFGYLQASKARDLHDLIAAHNHHGRAVLAAGDTTYVELPRDITQEHLDQSGLERDVRRFLEKSLPHVIADIGQRSDFAISDEEIAQLRARRHDIRYISWPEHHNYPSIQYRDGRQVPYLPPSIDEELYGLWRDARRVRRQRDIEERQRRRVKAQEEKQRVRIAKAEDRLQRDKLIVDLYTEGRSQMSVARELGIGQTTVARVLAESGTPLRTISHFDEVMERVNRCLEIVGLSGEGLTTKEISRRTGVAPYTVSEHLRDGRFFKDPTRSPERLAATLAATAESTDSSRRAQQRRRDRRVLMHLHPELFRSSTG